MNNLNCQFTLWLAFLTAILNNVVKSVNYL